MKRATPGAPSHGHLVVGTLVVVVLYVVLNAIFVLGPPAESIAGVSDVAAVTAHWLAGDWLERAVRVIIAIALFTSVSSMMMAAPRVYAKMAEDGYLPAALRFQGDKPRSRSPSRSWFL